MTLELSRVPQVSQDICYTCTWSYPTESFARIAHNIGQQCLDDEVAQPDATKLREVMINTYNTGQFAGALALIGREEVPVAAAWASSDEPKGHFERKLKKLTAGHFSAKLGGIYVLPEWRAHVDEARLLGKLDRQFTNQTRWVE